MNAEQAKIKTDNIIYNKNESNKKLEWEAINDFINYAIERGSYSIIVICHYGENLNKLIKLGYNIRKTSLEDVWYISWNNDKSNSNSSLNDYKELLKSYLIDSSWLDKIVLP